MSDRPKKLKSNYKKPLPPNPLKSFPNLSPDAVRHSVAEVFGLVPPEESLPADTQKKFEKIYGLNSGF